MSFLEDAWEFGKDVVESGVDAAEDGVDSIVGAAEDAGQAFVDAIDAAVEFGLDAVDAMAEAAEKAMEALEEAVEKLGEAVVAATNAVVDALGEFGKALAKGIDDLLETMMAVTEWIADKAGDLADWVLEEALPFVYGVLKLAVVAAILLATAPAWLLAAFICTQVANAYGEEYGSVLKAIAGGYPRYREMYRIRRLPAAGRYVIVSDLHRYPDGDLDIPTQQDDVRLYQAVLEHYFTNGWSLVENGDVEDFWLRGGSSWGVAYDLASGFTGVSQDAALEAGFGGIGELHLARIVGNRHYARLYGMLQLFHQDKRYFRTAGNHDDVYRNQRMVDALGRFFPAIGVDDFIVFDGSSGAVGIVAHGHQTDAWNSGACAYLGRVTTSITSAINDVLPDSMELGVPGDDKTALWDGEGDNTLIDVSPLIGVTLDTDSLDEPILHATYRETFGDDGPWLILGHTHAPKVHAWDKGAGRTWGRYVNEGCVIFPRMFTAVEWDGSLDADHPSIALVAWRYGAEPHTVARGVITPGSRADKLRSGPKQPVEVRSL